MQTRTRLYNDGGGGVREFAGTMRRSRAPRNRVISAARPNTCPIIFRAAALACRRVRRPGDKGFPCFWYRQLHPPIHPSWAPFRACPRFSLEPPSSAFSASFRRETNRGIIDVRALFERKKKRKEKVEGWLCRACKVAAAIRSHSRRFNELVGRARRTQPFR